MYVNTDHLKCALNRESFNEKYGKHMSVYLVQRRKTLEPNGPFVGSLESE